MHEQIYLTQVILVYCLPAEPTWKSAIDAKIAARQAGTVGSTIVAPLNLHKGYRSRQ